MTSLLRFLSSNSNPARNLSIALPVCMLIRDDGVSHGWLNMPGSVDGPRCDGMLARCGILPIQMPELPRELMLMPTIYGGRTPWSIIDANFHTLDRPPPGRTINSMLSVLHGDLRRHGFQQSRSDHLLRPDNFSILARLFTNRDIVLGHEPTGPALVDNLNSFEPFDVGDPIPSRRNEAQRKSVERMQWLTVHLIAKKIRGSQRILHRHASAEVLLHLDVTNLFLAFVAAEENHLNPVLLDAGLV